MKTKLYYSWVPSCTECVRAVSFVNAKLNQDLSQLVPQQDKEGIGGFYEVEVDEGGSEEFIRAFSAPTAIIKALLEYGVIDEEDLGDLNVNALTMEYARLTRGT